MNGQMTTGDAVRRLERHPYVVLCHHTGERHRVRSMRMAMKAAKKMARRMPGHAIHIHLPSGGPAFQPSSLVAVVSYGRSGYSVRFNQSLRGLGDVLTDWACSRDESRVQAQQTVAAGMSTGAQAALAGGLAAGLIGAILKRPVLGAVVGGLTGWGAHAVWTADIRS
jgi:hypothetical protein